MSTKTNKTKKAAKDVKPLVQSKAETGVFHLGDLVQWRSQSQGYVKKKSGEVVSVVRPGRTPSLVHKPGGPRRQVSYVVAVRQGKNRKEKMYWPRVSDLHAVKIAKELDWV
jgi:hypothetical protein